MSHYWGDDWFEKYGDDLCNAGAYISKFTKRWSRCYLIYKEKFGSLRYEYIVPPKGSVVSLRFCIKAPWKRKHRWGDEEFEYHPVLFAWNECWLYRKWELFGAWVCCVAIKRAIKKWPHLEDELCQDLHFNTKFGNKCQNKYWRTL